MTRSYWEIWADPAVTVSMTADAFQTILRDVMAEHAKDALIFARGNKLILQWSDYKDDCSAHPLMDALTWDADDDNRRTELTELKQCLVEAITKIDAALEPES
jgi:hypothetical protein